MKNSINIAIVGGGASGIFCAIALKNIIKDANVTIFEGQNKIGKKLLQTGNGKCNLLNRYLDSSKYNSSDISELINKYSCEYMMKLFNDMGLMLREDEEGRIYPYSEKATTVLDVFLNQLNKLNVEVITDTFITRIEKNNGFKLYSNNKVYNSDIVVVCTGGVASIHYKYNAYDVLERLGHSITKINPSLCALKVKENTKSLSGLKVKCTASIIVDGKKVASTKGEVLFKDNGLSGIAIFILSQYYQKDKKCYISLDLFEELEKEELNDKLNKGDLSNNLIGYFPKMINLDLINKSKNSSIGEIIKNYKFEIIDTYGFENAQVTKGGVKLDEVSLSTFESKKCENLYLAGEVLDVDGTCGGYNLYFAFASAYQIALSIKNKKEI